MGMFFNNDKKHYCGTYKGVKVWQYGCMIGNNWYGDFYITQEKNGRNYKVKDSVRRSWEDLKKYIDEVWLKENNN
jgi:hypothetical protein